MILKKKEMLFYLPMHSTHFIYGYIVLDTWQKTTEIAREETRCLQYMGYCFWLAAWDFFIHHPSDRIALTMAFVIPVVEHWPEQEIAQ